MKYAVMIDVDGELMYVNGKSSFPNHPDPKIFQTREEAEEECQKWNTAVVVAYEYIRPMTEEERNASKDRESKNDVHG